MFSILQIKTCKTEIDLKQQDLRETQTKADMQLLEHRSYLDRKEREFQKELDKLQRELDRQERIHSDLIGECHLLSPMAALADQFQSLVTMTTSTAICNDKIPSDPD